MSEDEILKDFPSLTRDHILAVLAYGVICYQVHLRNSHGVAYLRTAVMDGAVLSTSGSGGFTAPWNRLCARPSGGRDITAEVENVIRLPIK